MKSWKVEVIDKYGTFFQILFSLDILYKGWLNYYDAKRKTNPCTLIFTRVEVDENNPAQLWSGHIRSDYYKQLFKE